MSNSIAATPEVPRLPSFFREWMFALFLFIAGILVTSVSGYFHNDKDIAQRVTIVETKVDNADRRLERMESKLDRIIEGQQQNRR